MRRNLILFATAVVATVLAVGNTTTRAEDFFWDAGGETDEWDEPYLDFFGAETFFLNWSTVEFDPTIVPPIEPINSPTRLPGRSDTIIIEFAYQRGGTIDLNGDRTVGTLNIKTADFFNMNGGALTVATGNISRLDVDGVEANHLISSDVTLQQAGTLSIDGTGFLRIGGALTASAGFTKTGGAQLVLTNLDNQIGGTVTVRDGTLRISPFVGGYTIDHAINLRPLANRSPQLNITSNLAATELISTQAGLHTAAVVDVSPGVTFDASGGFGGPGRMMLTGGGTTRAGSIASDWFWIDEGTLELAGTIADTTSLHVAGGTFRATGEIDTNASLVVQAPNSIVDTGAHRVAFAAITSGPDPNFTLVKRGTGTLTGDIQSPFARVRLEAGTLETSTVANVDQLILAGGTLRPLGSTPVGQALPTTVAAEGGAIDLANDATIGVVLSGSGDLTKRGAGALTMSGQATSFTGGLAVKAGVLYLDLSDRTGAASASVAPGATLALSDAFQLQDAAAVNVGGNLQLDTAHRFTDLTLSGVGQVSGAGVLNLPEGAQLQVEQAGASAAVHADTSILGNLSNPNRPPVEMRVGPSNARLVMFGRVNALTLLRKTGLGTLALHGNSELFPGLQIDAGVVEVASSAAIFYDNDFMVNEGLIRLNGGTMRLTGDAVRLPGIALLSGGGTLDLNGHDARLDDFAADGAGRLTVTGGGTLRLGTANNFAGGVVLSGANLELANPLALGGLDRLAWNGGVVRAAAQSVGLPGLDLAAPGGFTFNALDLNGFDVVPTDTLTGPGRLFVTGEGALNFFGFGIGRANTHAGFGVVSGATLRIEAEHQLGALPSQFDPQHLMLNDGTLDTSGNFTIHSNRGVQIGAGGGTISVPGGTITIESHISSPNGFTLGGLTVDGGGSPGSSTVVLTGNNSYVGGTVITGDATLRVPDGASLSTGDITVHAGTTLQATTASGGAPVVGDVANHGLISGPDGFFFQPGVTFNGDVTGSGNFEGNVTFAGSYSPGDGDDATAQVSAGTLTLADTNTLAIEIAGAADYDNISATTTIALDGLIDLRFRDDFVPDAGDVITILTSDEQSINGFFDNAPPTATDVGGGGVELGPAEMRVGDIEFQLDYSANGGHAVVLRNFSVVPAILAGDYNNDGIVNLADYTVWRDNLGASEGTLPNDADGGPIRLAQYATWKANFGAISPASASSTPQLVPEPASSTIALLVLAAVVTRTCGTRR